MKRLSTFILIAMLLVSLAACGSKNESGASDTAATDHSAVSTEPATDAEKTLTVSTPYADLKIPASFEGKVDNKVSSKDPYTVSFFTADSGTELFSVIFNGEGDILLGTIIGDEENTVVYMDYAELNKKDKNYESCVLYQEQADMITNQLKKDYEFVLNRVVEREDDAVYDIKTDVITLKYPARWKDKVDVKVTKEAAEFSCGDTKLFDIAFEKRKNSLPLGEYKGTSLYLVIYELKKGKMSEKDFAELNLMQEDYSVILNNLIKDPDFALADN